MSKGFRAAPVRRAAETRIRGAAPRTSNRASRPKDRKSEEVMRARGFLTRALLLAVGWLTLMASPTLVSMASAQPVFDHMKCFTIKDGLRGAKYSVDLNAFDPTTFPPNTCSLRVPAKYLCVPA